MNRPAKIAIGCLLAPVGLFMIGLVILLGAKGMGVPEPRVAERNLEQDIPREFTRTALERTGADASDEQLRPERLAKSDVIRVDIDLEEGLFIVRPGPVEDGIRIDAEYDEASYELTQQYDMEDGIPVYRLRFRSKVHWLRRLAKDGSFDEGDMADNRIEVILPLDTPMQLRLALSKAEATDLDLSGLSLLSLDTKLRMGEFALESREPNPLVMDYLRAEIGMGEVEIAGIGNMHPTRVDVSGSMGEMRLDFGDALILDTEIKTRLRMGEMTLRVPDNVLWDPESRTSATFGEVEDQTRRRTRDVDPELAPRLRLNSRVTMGALILKEFRAERPARPVLTDQ